MKIVYLIDHLRQDGTQRVVGQLARALAKRGHRQAIVCLNSQADGASVKALESTGTVIRIVGKKKWMNGSGFVETHRWLRQEQFDVGVTFLYVSDLIGRPLLRAARVPRVISSLRARNVHYSGVKRALTRISMPFADRVVINSRTVREFAIAGEGVTPEQIVVIPNGICVDEYLVPLPRAQLVREFGVPIQARLLASVGRLTRQKGFDVLLKAFVGLRDKDTQLILIGKGEQEGELRAGAQALGISERVHFAGYRRDVPRLLGAFDVYVHPARFEGMPNAVMEAMAAGCPIVATTVDGTTELVRDGIDGWLVPPEDTSALGAALEQAIHDPIMARARGKTAQARAVTHYTETAMVDAWEQVLRG